MVAEGSGGTQHAQGKGCHQGAQAVKGREGPSLDGSAP